MPDNPERGKPPPDVAQERWRGKLGHDFSRVKIFDDSPAHQAARSPRAQAYFAPGRYAPGAGTGDRLLAPRVVHVVQQGAVARAATPSPVGGVAPGAIHLRTTTTRRALIQRQPDPRSAGRTRVSYGPLEALGLPQMDQWAQLPAGKADLRKNLLKVIEQGFAEARRIGDKQKLGGRAPKHYFRVPWNKVKARYENLTGDFISQDIPPRFWLYLISITEMETKGEKDYIHYEKGREAAQRKLDEEWKSKKLAHGRFGTMAHELIKIMDQPKELKRLLPRLQRAQGRAGARPPRWLRKTIAGLELEVRKRREIVNVMKALGLGVDYMSSASLGATPAHHAMAGSMPPLSLAMKPLGVLTPSPVSALLAAKFSTYSRLISPHLKPIVKLARQLRHGDDDIKLFLLHHARKIQIMNLMSRNYRKLTSAFEKMQWAAEAHRYGSREARSRLTGGRSARYGFRAKRRARWIFGRLKLLYTSI